MKLILIDAVNKEVKEIEVSEKNHFEEMKFFMGVEWATIARTESFDVWVDDEGLLKDPKHFFLIEGYPEPLAGNGIIANTDEEGNTISPTATLEEIRNKVQFVSVFDVVFGNYGEES